MEKGAFLLIRDLPEAWPKTREANGWTLFPEGRGRGAPRVVVFEYGNHLGNKFVAVSGPPEWVRHLAKSARNAWTAAELRADSGAVALAAKEMIPDTRPSRIDQRTGEVIEKIGERYAMRATIQGRDVAGVMEATKPEDVRVERKRIAGAKVGR